MHGENMFPVRQFCELILSWRRNSSPEVKLWPNLYYCYQVNNLVI